MNSQTNHKDDLLRQYVNPGKIEEAPEGFTSKVMTRIQIEAAPVKSSKRIWEVRLVPAITVSVSLLLILIAYLFQGSEADYMTLPVVDLINNFHLSLQEVNLTSVLSLKIPAICLYVLGGVLTLALFDRILNQFFHRER